jgi:hypothetical protein
MNRLAAKFKPGAGDWPGCTSLRSKETSHARSSGTWLGLRLGLGLG